MKLELSKDLYEVFRNDLEGVDYSKTNLFDLDKFENEKEIPITPDNVQTALKNLVIAKRRLASESDFEKFVAEQLAIVFGKERVHRQYSVGGFLALKTDIDVGNGQVGLELKIADHLSSIPLFKNIVNPSSDYCALYTKKPVHLNGLLLLLNNSIKPSLS